MTDDNGQDWIVVSKSLEYSNTSTKLFLKTELFLTTPKTVKLNICCKYRADFKAASDDITVIPKKIIEGKLEQRASWDGTFTVKYFDPSFENELPSEDDEIFLLIYYSYIYFDGIIIY